MGSWWETVLWHWYCCVANKIIWLAFNLYGAGNEGALAGKRKDRERYHGIKKCNVWSSTLSSVIYGFKTDCQLSVMWLEVSTHTWSLVFLSAAVKKKQETSFLRKRLRGVAAVTGAREGRTFLLNDLAYVIRSVSQMSAHQVTTRRINEKVTLEANQGKSAREDPSVILHSNKANSAKWAQYKRWCLLTLRRMEFCYDPFSEMFSWCYEIWERHICQQDEYFGTKHKCKVKLVWFFLAHLIMWLPMEILQLVRYLHAPQAEIIGKWEKKWSILEQHSMHV